MADRPQKTLVGAGREGEQGLAGEDRTGNGDSGTQMARSVHSSDQPDAAHASAEALAASHETQATAALLNDSQAPTQAAPPALSSLVDMSAMPAIQAPQLAAAASNGTGESAATDAEVGRVLADALDGGPKGGADIDTLLNNASASRDGGHAAASAAAAHAVIEAAAVPAIHFMPEGNHAMDAMAAAFDHAMAAAHT